MCLGTFSRRGAVASATIYLCAECASLRSAFLFHRTQFPMKQNKSYLTFSSSDSSFNKYPEVSLNNLSFFIFFFQSAMGLCLSLESPSFDYIYVNSLRDFFVVRFSNPLDRPPFSEAFLFVASLFLLSSLYNIKYNLSSVISNYFYFFLVYSEYKV